MNGFYKLIANAADYAAGSPYVIHSRHLGDLIRDLTSEAFLRAMAHIPHHVNNPLGIVQANIQFVAEQLGSDAYAGDVASAFVPPLKDSMIGADRIVDLMRALKGFKYVPKNVPRQAVGAESIVAFITGALPKDTDTATSPHIKTTVTFTRKVRVIQKGGIQEAINGIALNAYEAVAPKGAEGRIIIGVVRDGDFAVFTISDNGPGLSEKVLETAFEPFVTTKGMQRFGLGLSVALLAVIQHEGEIELRTQKDVGTTVTVRIPIAA